jgi:hypothetical protein
VSSGSISILPRVNEENISTHTSETTQGSEAGRTTSYDDGIVLGLRHRRDISSSNGSSITERDERRNDESGKEPHIQTWGWREEDEDRMEATRWKMLRWAPAFIPDSLRSLGSKDASQLPLLTIPTYCDRLTQAERYFSQKRDEPK